MALAYVDLSSVIEVQVIFTLYIFNITLKSWETYTSTRARFELSNTTASHQISARQSIRSTGQSLIRHIYRFRGTLKHMVRVLRKWGTWDRLSGWFLVETPLTSGFPKRFSDRQQKRQFIRRGFLTFFRREILDHKSLPLPESVGKELKGSNMLLILSLLPFVIRLLIFLYCKP